MSESVDSTSVGHGLQHRSWSDRQMPQPNPDGGKDRVSDCGGDNSRCGLTQSNRNFGTVNKLDIELRDIPDT
jgi:hypothetical protein